VPLMGFIPSERLPSAEPCTKKAFFPSCRF
jgi:hypothetical protein